MDKGRTDRSTGSVDDTFKRSLELDRQRCFSTLEELELRHGQLPAHRKESLVKLVHDIYGVLHTKLFPKRASVVFATSLYEAGAKNDYRVALRFPLASPTAVRELSTFLHCVDTFRRNGFSPEVEVLMVRWENLIEVANMLPKERQELFKGQLQEVRRRVWEKGLPESTVVPVDITFSMKDLTLSGPADFKRWWRATQQAQDGLTSADPALVRDVQWSQRFYRRQRSLCKLGGIQPSLDLAVRRSIGERFMSSLGSVTYPVCAVLTSELAQHFLFFYQIKAPMMNVEIA